MSYWKKSEHSYNMFVEIPEQELLMLVNALSREDIIEWLMWNDPNGIYSDEQSAKELGNIMSRDEGMEILLRQAEENRVIN